MKEKYYKEKLKTQAANAAVPDVLEEIKRADFSACRADASDIIPQINPQRTSPQKKKRITWAASIAAAAFIFIFAFAILPQLTAFDSKIYATVTLNFNIDENASAVYSIEINKNSKVIDIAAETSEEDAVLQKFSYKEKNFDNALTELLKTCVDYWDLSETQLDEVTFSVECHDTTAKAKLENSCHNSMTAARQHCQNKHGYGHN